MSEFQQEGLITTIHGFYDLVDREEYIRKLEERLSEYSKHVAVGLLLPSLYAEIHVPKVLDRMIDEINQVDYLDSVVVALGGAAKRARFEEAKEFFSRLKKKGREVTVVWVEGPRVQKIFKRIRQQNIDIGRPGKGQSVWIGLGYLFAKERCQVIALHDCDIVTYDRLLLGRLVEPAANPNNDFEFCKGYYARISPTELQMKGRVTRLFVTPFVESLGRIMRWLEHQELEDFFRYHRAFRYPLAGEFSFLTRLGKALNVAYDWGLEVSTLSEVHDRLMPKKIAQVDLSKNYEHKHQTLSEEDANKGLHRMIVDITKFYLNYMRAHGMAIDDAFIDMLQRTYHNTALGFVKSYSDDAESNGLIYNRHEEEQMVTFFTDFIGAAWEQARGQRGGTQIPSWNRVTYSVPDIYKALAEAVEEDNR